MAKDTNSSANIKELISADPHSIKLALINLMEKRLGTEADTFEAGFGGYLIQALTLLTSDTLSSLAFSYNEAFTNKCTLRSSANDLGKMFDYTIKNAKPCTGNMTVQIMFPTAAYETYSTKIQNGSLCSNSSIQYMVNGTYEIDMNYSACYIRRKDPNSQTVTNVPYTTVLKDGKKYASFNVNVWQIKVFEHTFNFSNVEYQKFYDVNISGFEDSIYDMNVGVYITQENESYTQLIKFKKIENIYSATPMDKVYSVILGKNNSATIRFGNGVFGYQPEEGQQGKIIIYTTMGSKGAVVSNVLSLNTSLKDIKSNTSLQVSSSNLGNINNGEDEEDIETLKANIINQISMAKRLVTRDDYKKYNSITGLSSINLYPMLLRRDTNTNEIDLFAVMYGTDGKPVPMNSLSVYTPVPNSGNLILLKDHIYRVYYKKGNNFKSLISVNTVPTSPEDGKSYYVDDDYRTVNTDWSGHAGEIATYDGTGHTWSFIDPTDDTDPTNPLWNKIEYVCPYNISYDPSTSRALYEYIPSKLTLSSNLEYLTSYSGVEMNIKNTVITVLPENSMEYSNLTPSHFNIVTTIDYNSSMNFENVRVRLKIHNDIPNTYSSENTTIPEARRLYFEKEYEMKILSNNEFDNTVQMLVNIPISDIPFVEIMKGTDPQSDDYNPDYISNASLYPDETKLNVLVFTNTVTYLDKEYNTYSRKLILRNREGKNNISEEYIENQLEYTYNSSDPMTMEQTKASITNIEFGINTILFNWSSWKSGSSDVYGYEVTIYMYKLITVNSMRIKCEFEFAGTVYDPYTRGVGGNGSVLVYKIRIPYNYSTTPIGETTFKIRFGFDFNNSETYTVFSIYNGSIIARHRMTNTIWSTVIKETNPDFEEDDEMYKIYKIPVIEKNYYEENYETLESRILYAISEVDTNFNQFKMLTDSVNIKFANTCGLTQNLKYNHQSNGSLDPLFTYTDWSWDTPPTISLKVILNLNNSNRNSTEIIEECKNVILTFLSIKTTGFAKSILRSDIIRFIHDSIPEVASCEVVYPTRDIIYLLDEYNLPTNKDELLSYVPDFIWIDKDKISIEVINIPTI